MLEKFGCDLLRYSTNPVTARKLSSFMLSKVGDITWHYHAGIMTFPIQTAVRYKIPLIVWGDHGESMYFGRNNLSDNVEFTKKNRQEHLMRGFEPEDILDDPENKESYKIIRDFSNKLIDKALSLEGTITGEHGIGIQKKEYLLKQHPDNIPLMQGIKKTLDPKNILNPGKIFNL